MGIERILSIIRSKPSKIKYILVGILLSLIAKTVLLLDGISENTNFYDFIGRNWNVEGALLDVLILSVITPLLILVYYGQKYYINNVRGAAL